MFAQNQQNTLPTTGNVGVGTLTPNVKLQVNGSMKVDSSLTVKDTAVFEKQARMKDKIVVESDAVILGTLKAKSDLKVQGTAKLEGDVKMTNLSTANNNDTTLLFVNQNGKVKAGGVAQFVTTFSQNPSALLGLKTALGEVYQPVGCIDPSTAVQMWVSQPGKTWIGWNCETKVGINTDNPLYNFDLHGTAHIVGSHFFQGDGHVVGNNLFEGEVHTKSPLTSGGTVWIENASLNIASSNTNTFAKLLVENPNRGAAIQINSSGNTGNYDKLLFMQFDGSENTEIFNVEKIGESTPRFLLNSDGSFHIYNGTQKLLQMDNAGVVHSREIYVNTQNWPDFVFKKDYVLPTLSQIAASIEKEGHLPGVPSAAQIENDGQNVGEMNKILLQKVEELTLHLIAQEKELKEQREEIQRLQELIKK